MAENRELAILQMHHRYIQLKRHHVRLVGKQGSGSLKVSQLETVVGALFCLLLVKGSQQVKLPTPPLPSIGLTIHSTGESVIRLILILENCPPATQTQLRFSESSHGGIPLV
jgi:hypothetical protein